MPSISTICLSFTFPSGFLVSLSNTLLISQGKFESEICFNKMSRPKSSSDSDQMRNQMRMFNSIQNPKIFSLNKNIQKSPNRNHGFLSKPQIYDICLIFQPFAYRADSPTCLLEFKSIKQKG
jgi:hypothetical protein